MYFLKGWIQEAFCLQAQPESVNIHSRVWSKLVNGIPNTRIGTQKSWCLLEGFLGDEGKFAKLLLQASEFKAKAW